MRHTTVPGRILCVDELFSFWSGAIGKDEPKRGEAGNDFDCEKHTSGDADGLFVDEREDDYYRLFTPLPHSTYIPGKPRGVGVMMKCLADGASKIMLKLKIQEGREAMQSKDFQVRKMLHISLPTIRSCIIAAKCTIQQ